MKNLDYEHLCLVCGQIYEASLTDAREDIDGFCDCCGCHFGADDYSPVSARAQRKEWLEEEGGRWFLESRRPSDWNLEEQLKNIPPEWR